MRLIVNAIPFAVCLLGAAAMLGACGSETKTSSTSTCCYNGAFYDCDKATNSNCTDPNTDCTRDSSRDGECQ